MLGAAFASSPWSISSRGNALEAERSMHGAQVVALLTRAIEERSAVPRSITLDNGGWPRSRF